MKFRTELSKGKHTNLISYSDKILCIGSCFAEHLHKYLSYRKYNSFLNPCGITYNPISIANSIYYLLEMVHLNIDDIHERNGIYYHFDFHSIFSGTSRDIVYNNILQHLEKARMYLEADVLIISLGTAFTYFQSLTNEAVNNCHKIPQTAFEKIRLSIDQTANTLNSAIAPLRKINPNLKVVVTVSPVRHIKDGIVNNNLSKSTLLLAVQELEDVHYFPSYELLLDDLRDYRFYDRDLVHPSQEAVEYILDFFEGQFFNEVEMELRKQIVSVQNNLKHRAFFPESEQHQNFLRKLKLEMQTIMSQSNVDFTDEIHTTEQQILE